MKHNKEYYEFGPFELDAAQRMLTRHGQPVPLSPKTMDILLVFVRRAGQLVEKDELMHEVWPDAFVEEGNLSQAVFNLRKALGDQRTDAQYIETISRHGYRFVARVKQIDRAPSTDEEPAMTLAVLPFVNDTGDAQLDYLAEGIGENIIRSLSQISKLRVMSRTSIGKFKGKEWDLKEVSVELRVGSLLFGRITAKRTGLVVSVELVDAANGWLLWGASLDCSTQDILEVQDEIVKQTTAKLALDLSRDEERKVTARYTENPDAYKAYLEGRFFWSRFTLDDIQRAIGHFRRAIEHDSNYALAYSAIIDCYLRLTTNYVPPNEAHFEDASGNSATVVVSQRIDASTISGRKLRLRHEWDWKGAERELRRAQALKLDYPSAHQWYSAYVFVRQLYEKLHLDATNTRSKKDAIPPQIRSIRLTPSEEVQVFAAIGREQIVIGNFCGAELVLQRWLPKSGWPKLHHLDPHIAADLLFTLGNLIGVLALIGHIKRGVKRAEAYLSGAIALFEQLGAEVLACEARIELARCYYREGLFDDSREMLDLALTDLPYEQTELRSLGLAVYGCVDRDAGRLQDSLKSLRESCEVETGQLVTGFRELQLATTLKELAIVDSRSDLSAEAVRHFQQALYEFEAIGNHTNTAATENNFGFLLLAMHRFSESEKHLLRALRLFTTFGNDLRAAQVNETLAQLYLANTDLPKAHFHISEAVRALETTDGDAILAEALNTKGIVACRQLRFTDGRNCFESSYRTAERCGDYDGAVRAILSLIEEMPQQLTHEENLELTSRLNALQTKTNQLFLLERIARILDRLSTTIES